MMAVYNIMALFKNQVVDGWKPYDSWEDSYVLDFEFKFGIGSVYFNQTSGDVYMIQVSSNQENDSEYKWINPDYEKDCDEYHLKNGIRVLSLDDFVDRVEYIMSGEKIEEWANVEIQLTTEEFNTLSMLAHQKNITFNQLVNKILEDYIENKKLVERHFQT